MIRATGIAGLLVFVHFFAVEGAAGQTAVTLFEETFNAAAVPDLPAGWTASADGWMTDDGSASNGSGGNNLYVKGGGAGHVTTPILDFSSLAEGTLSYLARRTGTYLPDSLQVTASTDGGASFPVTLLAAGAALPSGDGSYEQITTALPAALLGEPQVVLRFEALGGGSGSANLRIDDALIRGTVEGIFVAPARLTFAAETGETQALEVEVTNYGDQPEEVAAPQVTGAAFSIAPAGAVTLTPGAEQIYTVTYAPTSAGPHEGSTIAFPYALGESVVRISGRVVRNQFGFSSTDSTVLAETGVIEIPLSLNYDGAEALQSLQFTVAWDNPDVQFAGIARGTAVAEGSVWTLSHEAGAQQVEVILLGSSDGGLPASIYNPLLTLQVEGGAFSQSSLDVTFSLSNIVGALAVPTGDDAGLQPGTRMHTLTIGRGQAVFDPSASVVAVGAVEAGKEGAAEVVVANTDGTRDLTISDAAGNNSLFSVTPTSAVIPPGEDQSFTVAFAPSVTAFGHQADTLVFSHDGTEESTSRLIVTGRGTYGRGDTNGDGVVDVVDIVQAIDFILDRLAPDSQQLGLVDLFPFSEGDGALDVRDLTVLAQGIAHNQWPDAVRLPAVAPAAASPVQERRAAGDQEAGVTAWLTAGEDGLVVELEHDQPVRAVQLVLQREGKPADPAIVLEEKRASQSTALAGVDEAAGTVRLLVFRPDGKLISPGRYPFALLERSHPDERITFPYTTAVDEAGKRMNVKVVPSVQEQGKQPPLPERFQVGAPYPHPFSARGGVALQVPVALPEAAQVRAALFDMAGRRIKTLPDRELSAGRTLLTWNGRSDRGLPVGPGLYVLQVIAGKEVATRPVIVVQ